MGNMFNAGPRFPPSKNGEYYSQMLNYVMYGHLVIAVIKMILGGFGAGMGDIFSCLILWCAYS